MSQADVEVTPSSHMLSRWRLALADVVGQPPVQALDLHEGDAILVVGAHPDDETFGVAGTIASLVAGGIDVHVLSMSSGEAPLQGVGMTVSDLAGRRRAELVQASGILGATSVAAMGFPDGRLGEYENEMAAVVDATARRYGVRRLLSVASCDPHPDHAAVAQAALEAGARGSVPVTGYLIWALHWTDPNDSAMKEEPMTLMSLDAQARASRRSAIDCYRTQTEPLASGVASILPPSFVANDIELLVG